MTQRNVTGPSQLLSILYNSVGMGTMGQDTSQINIRNDLSKLDSKTLSIGNSATGRTTYKSLYHVFAASIICCMK
jgi:hypothetical protein